MKRMIYYLLYLLGRKKILLHIPYLLVIIVLIVLNYNTKHQPCEVVTEAHVVKILSTTTQNSHVTIPHGERTELLMNQCDNQTNSSHLVLPKIPRYDKVLNYLGFIVRSHSLFYCSVPKVATRTLLAYISYLHIRDELLITLQNSSITYFNEKSNLFSVKSINRMLSTSIKNDSVLLLSKLLKEIKNSSSELDIWLVHQYGSFPHVRLRTLSDPSILLSNSFTRAIFVRHPLERLASAYTDKIGTLKSRPLSYYDLYRREICRKYASSYLTKVERKFYRTNKSAKIQINEPCAKVIPSFKHFIKYIMSTSFQFDVHWFPYSRLCNVCTLKYNFIGKYETIEEDLNSMRLKLGFSSSDWKIDNHFSTGKSKDSYKLLYSNLTKGLLCNLKDFYSQDFRYFNYRLEDYLIDRKDIDCPSRSYRRF